MARAQAKLKDYPVGRPSRLARSKWLNMDFELCLDNSPRTGKNGTTKTHPDYRGCMRKAFTKHDSIFVVEKKDLATARKEAIYFDRDNYDSESCLRKYLYLENNYRVLKRVIEVFEGPAKVNFAGSTSLNSEVDKQFETKKIMDFPTCREGCRDDGIGCNMCVYKYHSRKDLEVAGKTRQVEGSFRCESKRDAERAAREWCLFREDCEFRLDHMTCRKSQEMDFASGSNGYEFLWVTDDRNITSEHAYGSGMEVDTPVIPIAGGEVEVMKRGILGTNMEFSVVLEGQNLGLFMLPHKEQSIGAYQKALDEIKYVPTSDQWDKTRQLYVGEHKSLTKKIMHFPLAKETQYRCMVNFTDFSISGSDFNAEFYVWALRTSGAMADRKGTSISISGEFKDIKASGQNLATIIKT